MDTPLLTIGTFANSVGLTASALRHYDDCGLLVPAEVDEETGYRYYTADLGERARLVSAMRDAGVPIDVMRVVLDGGSGAAQEALERFLAEQQERSARSAVLLGEVLASRIAEAHDPSSAGGPAGPVGRARIAGPTLAAAIRQVHAAAGDGGSPLGSVLLDVTAGGGLDVVATNRYWMAVRTLATVVATPAARTVLDRAAAMDLATLLEGEDIVDLTLYPGHLVLFGVASEDSVRVIGRRVAGRDVPYPAHRMIVDALEPPRARAVLDADALRQAVDATNRSELRLVLAEDGATVGADDHPDTAVAGVLAGEALTVRLGRGLLARVLGTVLGPRLLLGVTAEDRPVRVSSPSQPGYLALLMPIAES